MIKNKTKNWIEIDEEFRNKFNPEIGSHDNDCECSDCAGILDIDEVLKFFKPYFQEILHDNVVEELEKPELLSYDTNYLQKEEFKFEILIEPKEQPDCRKCMNLENGSIIMVSKDNHCLDCGRKVGGFCG